MNRVIICGGVLEVCGVGPVILVDGAPTFVPLEVRMEFAVGGVFVLVKSGLTEFAIPADAETEAIDNATVGTFIELAEVAPLVAPDDRLIGTCTGTDTGIFGIFGIVMTCLGAAALFGAVAEAIPIVGADIVGCVFVFTVFGIERTVGMN